MTSSEADVEKKSLLPKKKKGYCRIYDDCVRGARGSGD